MAHKKWIGVATASAFGVGAISAGAAMSFAQTMPLADEPAVTEQPVALALTPERTFEVSSEVIAAAEPAVLVEEPTPVAPAAIDPTPGEVIPVDLPQVLTPTVTVPAVNSPLTPATVPSPQSPASPLTQPSPVSPATPASPVSPASPASPASAPTPPSVV